MMTEASHIKDLEDLLAFPPAQRFLRTLMIDRCGLRRSAYAESASDTSYLLGRQSIGQEILNELIAVQPAAITLLLEETKNAQE